MAAADNGAISHFPTTGVIVQTREIARATLEALRLGGAPAPAVLPGWKA